MILLFTEFSEFTENLNLKNSSGLFVWNFSFTELVSLCVAPILYHCSVEVNEFNKEQYT